MHRFLFILFVAFSYFNLHAQDTDRIDTDRPDQTESAVILTKKYLQAEFGFNKENYDFNNYTLVFPTFLLKYGVSKRMELRLETSLSQEYIQKIPEPEITTGIEPVNIGVKIALAEEKGILPKTSVLAHLGLPFASTSPDKDQSVFPSIRLSMQHTLTKTIGLGYNAGAEWDGYTSTPVWLYTFSPNFTIGKRWYAYVEAFGFLSKLQHPQHNVDAGIAYYVSNNVKIDLSAGKGVSKHPTFKNYVAIGFSFRLPVGKGITSSAR
jgi:hypothetical protein